VSRHVLIRVALAVGVVAVMVLGGQGPVAAEGDRGMTVTAGPRWGAVPFGSWTPYSVTVRNDGATNFEGEVVLVPEPEPPAKPGARPTRNAPTSMTVRAIGSRVVTSPPPLGRGAAREAPPWPVYRTPVTVSVGTEKTLTVMVLEAPFGYRVELRDRADRTVTGSPGSAPALKKRRAVLLLSDVIGAEATLEAMPQKVAPGLDVIQLGAARAFPDLALHLAGLDAVVLDDFDTATLTVTQRRALQDYVSLGGSLVVTGGAAWSRTLGSLPPGLTPLLVSGSTTASLGPLADLAATTTAGTSEVATGEATMGSVVLAVLGGPPLVLEAPYHGGRVVQLAYDPLAQPFASDQVLRELAWDQALGRIARWGGIATGTPSSAIAEDQLWGPSLGAREWPPWPATGIGMLVLYAAALGPVAFVLASRRPPAVTGVVIPLAVVLALGGSVLATRERSEVSETVVEVQTLGAEGTVLKATYRGAVGLNGANRLHSAPGAALSTIFSGHRVFHNTGAGLDPLGPNNAQPSPARGLGGGVVLTGDRPGVRFLAKAWELQTVESLSIDQDGPSLDATLRLVGTSSTSLGRFVGRVTNRGSVPIYQVRAQIVDGQAQLAHELAPGQSLAVDAPVTTVASNPQQSGLLPSSPEEVVMYAAAGRAYTGPDQVVLAGLISPPPKDAMPSTNRAGRSISVVVATVPLQAAETILTGSGGARFVSISPSPDGGSVSIQELKVPPGVGPLTIHYPARISLPGEPEPPQFSIEVYNWTTATWRTLPPTGRPPAAGRPIYAYVENPLDGSEVSDGLVRVRGAIDQPLGVVSDAYLILTINSQKEARA